MVASIGGCGDDSLRQVGDENGSSFAIDFDLRWCAGVVVSGFTKNPRSISAFWVSEQSYLMVQKAESYAYAVCGQKAWESSLL
jgi:hypothetical protein